MPIAPVNAMSDDRAYTNDYYALLIEHLKEGRCSPHALAAFERRLRESREPAGGDGHGRAEKDLVLEIALAEKLDELFSIAQACRDSGDSEMAVLVNGLMEEIRSAADRESFEKAASKAAVEIDAFSARREDLLKLLTSAMMDYLTIICCHGADGERRLAIHSLDEKCASIEKRGETLRSLLFHPWFAAHLPVPETELEATAEAMEQMRRWPAIERGAVSQIREEVEAALSELSISRHELRARYEEDEKRTVRAGFLAVSPADSAGPYSFTKIWEGKSS